MQNLKLNLNPDNIVLVKLVNGSEIIGRDESVAGSSDHVIKAAYFVQLGVDNEKSTNDNVVYKPTFEPLSVLVDPAASVNSEVDVTLPATSVLFKLPIHPNVIPHYKQLTSPIILQ